MPKIEKSGFQTLPTLAIALPEEAIADFCKQWKVEEFYLFGSILRDDFHADSDVDVMVQFAPNARFGLFEFMDMKAALEKICARKVDLLTKKSIEKSRNWIRRNEILGTARLFYVAR